MAISRPLSLLFKKANSEYSLLIQRPPGNVQSRFRRPLNFSASVTHAHCIFGGALRRRSLLQPGHRVSEANERAFVIIYFVTISSCHTFRHYLPFFRVGQGGVLEKQEAAAEAGARRLMDVHLQFAEIEKSSN